MDGEKDMSLEGIKFFKRKGYFKNPQYVQIEITNFCPLDCPQCYKKEANYAFLSLAHFITIVEEAYTAGVKEIFLNGGEPLIHKNFCDMVNYCEKIGLKCTVFTSGYGIENITALRDSSLKIHISLNGSSRKVNEKSRDGYQYAVKAMDFLRVNQIEYGINWVARHDNVYNLPQIIELSKKRGASYINIVCNKMTGMGRIESPLDRADYLFLRKTINENSSFCMIQNCYGILLSLMGEPNHKLYGCQAGIRLMAVTVEGKYMPCTHLHYEENCESILDYWENSTVLKKLREFNDMKYCSECKKCRVCHSISREAHDNFQIGFKDCPLR